MIRQLLSPSHSYFSFGIICGRGSFAVSGSFAVGDHLQYCTALFDCAINEKCCGVDGGRGIRPLFSSPPRGIWQLKIPHPREFAIRGKKKKNANARGSAGRGRAGRSWNWLMPYVLSVTFCGAVVLKVMDQKTLIKRRWSYKVRITVYILTLGEFARHKFTNLWLETLPDTLSLALTGIRLSPKQVTGTSEQRLAYH